MFQSRNSITIFFFLTSLLAGLYAVYTMNLTPDSWGYWVGLGIGGLTAITTCFLAEREIRRKKEEPPHDTTKNQTNESSGVSTSTSKWLIPSVIGGIIIAKLVENLFNQEIQNLINNFVFAWIVVGSGYLASLAWRFMSD